MLQRLWLLAAQASLTTHPLSALLDAGDRWIHRSGIRVLETALTPSPSALRGANIGCADPLRGANIGCADVPVRGRGEQRATPRISPPLPR